MIQVYNKLVRDKIPEIVKSKGKTPEIEIVDGSEVAGLLVAKLLEEAREVDEANQNGEINDIIEEMADVEEVLRCLRNNLGITAEQVEEARKKKVESNGSFEKGIRLLSVNDHEH